MAVVVNNASQRRPRPDRGRHVTGGRGRTGQLGLNQRCTQIGPPCPISLDCEMKAGILTMPALGLIFRPSRRVRVRSVDPSILLQKSFGGDERNFLGPLMRFVRRDVRDLIAHQKNGHGASYRRHRVLQRRSRLKFDFREIFGVVRFSTFATLSRVERTCRSSGFTSGFDPGRVERTFGPQEPLITLVINRLLPVSLGLTNELLEATLKMFVLTTFRIQPDHIPPRLRW
jgi:hypothetical protein